MKTENISDYYNTISHSYNELYGEEQNDKYRISLSNEAIELDKISTILDIGMGSGLLVNYLNKSINGKYVYYIGIDISCMLVRLAPRDTDFVVTDYILCDGEKIPVRLKPIDLITLYTVIHHFRYPKKFLEYIWKNYSKILIVSFLGHSPDEIKGILSEMYNKINNFGGMSTYKYRDRETIYILNLMP